MKLKIFFVFAALLLFISSSIAEEKTLVDQIYVKSGLATQIPALSKQLDQTAKAYGPNLPPKIVKGLNKEFKRLLNPSVLEARIKENLKKNAKKDILTHMLKWYNSPLGKRISKMEEKSSSDSETKKMVEFIKKNKDMESFPKRRMDFIKRLIKSTEATNYAVDLAIYVNISILDIINDLNPNTKPLTKVQLKHFFYSQRPEMLKKLKDQMIIMSLFNYKNLSDDDLLKYVKFNELVKTKTFNKLLIKSMLKSVYTKQILQ